MARVGTVSFRAGPRFDPPPRSVVVELERRAPGVWRRFSSGIDQAIVGAGDVVGTNWFRTAADNARVGGARYSQHRWGMAVDLVVRASSRPAVVSRLRRAGFHVIDEGDHLHVQVFGAGVLPASGIRPG